MSNPNKIIKNNVYWFCLGVFMFYLFIAYNTPLTHDDWTWGTSIGWARLENWFNNYNGRYLGNLLEIFVTRSEIGRILLIGIFSSLIVMFSAILAKQDKLFFYILSFLAFLCVPNNMFAQTYAWAAGFSNYIPSIVLSLLFLYISKDIFESKPPEYNKWLTFFMIPLGICSQLFVEHIMLFNIFTAVFVIIYTYFKFKKVYLLQILYLFSTMIGALLLLTNGAYLAVLKGTDTYRTVSTGTEQLPLIQRLFDIYTGQMYPLLFMNNVVLNILLAIFSSVIIIKNLHSISGFKKIVSTCMLFILVLYPLYKPLLINEFRFQILHIYTNEFEAFISVLFYLSLLLIPVIFIKERDLKLKLIYYLVSVIVLAVPFFFVTPLGPRCFLASYTFFVLFLIEISVYIYHNQNIKININLLMKPFLFWILTVVLSYGYIFISIHSANVQREQSIKAQLNEGRNVITIFRLPFENYLWVGTPNKKRLQGRTFKEFYHIPPEKDFKVITFEKWSEQHKK